MEKVNILDKFSLFNDYWNPRVVGQLNGQHIKLGKFQGEFVWHKHANEDEMFYVVKGEFTMMLREKSILIRENEFLIVPRGVEHKPVANDEVWVMLFEPAETLNTGDINCELTRENLEQL